MYYPVSGYMKSLPSRERGLKSELDAEIDQELRVPPFTGAWIEIQLAHHARPGAGVAPFTGAWIEISRSLHLKAKWLVAPFTGAWIEI